MGDVETLDAHDSDTDAPHLIKYVCFTFTSDVFFLFLGGGTFANMALFSPYGGSIRRALGLKHAGAAFPFLSASISNRPRATLTEYNAETASARAADVIIGRLPCQIGDKKASAASLRTDLPPVYGATWNRAILTRVDAYRIDCVMARMRNSRMPSAEYGHLSDFWK